MTRSASRPQATPVALALLFGSQALWLFLLVLQRKGDFGWDAAAHTLWGFLVYQDVSQGKWISLLIDTYRQVYWPFMHSWFVAVSMISLGANSVASRLVSLVAYAITGVVLGLLARRTAPRSSFPSIAVAVGLWLTMTGFLFEYATEALIESLAIAVTAVSLLALARAIERDTQSAYMLAGTAAMFTYFTKTGFGIVLILATAVAALLYHRRHGSPNLRRNSISYLSPIVVLSTLWFAYPPKVIATINALINRRQGPKVLSVEGLFFHFEQLIRWWDATTYTELAIAVILILSLVFSFRLKKTAFLYVIVAYIVVAFALHTASHTKDMKHIVKVLPWTFLLVGWQAGLVWEAIRGARRSRTLLRYGFACACVAVLGWRAATLVGHVSHWQHADLKPVRRAIVDLIGTERSHIVLGAFWRVSPHTISWHVLISADSPRSTVIVPDPIYAKNPRHRKEHFDRLLEEVAERYPIVKLLERQSQRQTYRLAYLYTKRPGNDPDNAAEVLRTALRQVPDPDRLIVLDVDPTSPLYSREYIHPGHDFVPLLSANPEYAETRTIHFPADRIHVRVFDRVRRPSIGLPGSASELLACDPTSETCAKLWSEAAVSDHEFTRSLDGLR